MTLTSVLVLFIDFSLCSLRLMLFVCKGPTALLLRSVLGGSLLRGFRVLFLSDPRIHVGLLCCTVLGRMMLVGSCSMSLLFRPNSFAWLVFMHQIGILLGMIFSQMLRLVLTLRFLHCSVGTSMLFLTIFLTRWVLTLLIFFVRALLLSLAFFLPAVSLIFGVICIRPLTVLLGLGGTAFLPPVLISLVFLFLGFLLSPRVISFLFCFLITVRFTYLSRSRGHCPGSWTLEVKSGCSR